LHQNKNKTTVWDAGRHPRDTNTIRDARGTLNSWL